MVAPAVLPPVLEGQARIRHRRQDRRRYQHKTQATIATHYTGSGCPGMNRRDFLSTAAAFFLDPQTPADVTLQIGTVDVAIAPKRTIRTIGYNGSFPGPVLRFPEGRSVTVDVVNGTATPELVHWHGLFLPTDVDGSAEEGTPMVASHGRRRYSFVPRPSGTRWYHSHVYAGRDLHRSTYSGQYGILILEPRQNPARYDREIPLALHGWNRSEE